MLKARILTAVVLATLMIVAILQLPPSWFTLITGGVVVVSAWEWSRLAGWQTWLAQLAYALILGLGLWLTYQGANWPPLAWLVSLAALGWWMLALFWVWRYQQGHFAVLPATREVKSLLGLLLLVPAWLALYLIHLRYGSEWLLFLLVLIWTADTGAFFAGRRWGKTKLADKVSPGKSREGVLGALLMSLLLAGGYAVWQNLTGVYSLLFVLLCLLTVLASILGDLLESLFKRQMGVKDSSQLLPGHGGILDRIDSLTAAAPLFLLGLLALHLEDKL